jgi:hypothetical protein
MGLDEVEFLISFHSTLKTGQMEMGYKVYKDMGEGKCVEEHLGNL